MKPRSIYKLNQQLLLLEGLNVFPTCQACEWSFLFSRSAMNSQREAAGLFQHLSISHRLFDALKYAHFASDGYTQFLVH